MRSLRHLPRCAGLLMVAVFIPGPKASSLLQEPDPQPAESPETVEEASPALPLPGASYSTRQGKGLFLHYCATCHGQTGRGDGFNAYSLDPKPRDLAAPEFQQQRSDDDLIALIRSGGGAIGLSNAMPPWGRALSQRQISQLVDYLRTLEESSEEN